MQFASLLTAKSLAILIAFTGAAAAGDEMHPRKVTLDSKMNMEVSGSKQAIDAHTEFEYTWQKAPQLRSLIFDRFAVKATVNGKDATSMSMSLEKFTIVQDGKAKEVPFAEAPDGLKSNLRDSFGVPLVELQVDAAGNELSRKTTARPGAKGMLDNGAIANGLLFHPPKPPSQAAWQVEREMSMGNGGYVKGKLTYKRLADRPGEVFAVSGTLTKDQLERAGTPLMFKDIRYDVSGEQTFLPAQNEWVSGTFNVAITFDITANEKPVGKSIGIIVATMETRK